MSDVTDQSPPARVSLRALSRPAPQAPTPPMTTTPSTPLETATDAIDEQIDELTLDGASREESTEENHVGNNELNSEEDEENVENGEEMLNGEDEIVTPINGDNGWDDVMGVNGDENSVDEVLPTSDEPLLTTPQPPTLFPAPVRSVKPPPPPVQDTSMILDDSDEENANRDDVQINMPTKDFKKSHLAWQDIDRTLNFAHLMSENSSAPTENLRRDRPIYPYVDHTHDYRTHIEKIRLVASPENDDEKKRQEEEQKMLMSGKLVELEKRRQEEEKKLYLSGELVEYKFREISK